MRTAVHDGLVKARSITSIAFAGIVRLVLSEVWSVAQVAPRSTALIVTSTERQGLKRHPFDRFTPSTASRSASTGGGFTGDVFKPVMGGIAGEGICLDRDLGLNVLDANRIHFDQLRIDRLQDQKTGQKDH